ncbi:MAG TPA: hypothetical protein VJV05_11695 [Pyrinomonadaceae bacterium]|nr:hypothetical protein [Pyrinomonadaceae bacterium]
MGADFAEANVNRSYTLAASSIAIFTFTLFFLYPRFVNGEANPLLFQAAIIVIGMATFSFVFASLFYYRSSMKNGPDENERTLDSRRGDRFWLFGYTLLFLAPTVILFSIGLLAVASVWLTLWLVYFIFVIRYFPGVRT